MTDFSKMKKKSTLAVLLSFVIIVVSFLIYFFRVGNHWGAYAYSTLNNGKDPIFMGSYASEDNCREEANRRIQAEFKMEDGTKANAFACGEDCIFEGLAGSVLVSEIKCTKTFFSIPLDKTN